MVSMYAMKWKDDKKRVTSQLMHRRLGASFRHSTPNVTRSIISFQTEPILMHETQIYQTEQSTDNLDSTLLHLGAVISDHLLDL